MRLSGREVLGDVVGTGSTEDDDVEKGVGSKSVGTVDGNAGGLSGGVETGDDLVLTVLQRKKRRMKRDQNELDEVGEGS